MEKDYSRFFMDMMSKAIELLSLSYMCIFY